MQTTTKNSGMALVTLISVFFFWGFVAASNDILIPVFKSALQLKQWQSQMISFAFYVAYTVGSIIYFLLTSLLKKDILNTMGYRNGLALGLIISALGTLLFIPASNTQSFFLLISGLFIVGLGFSLQQIAANPLAINMGDPTKGNMRLSLAGGINNVGTTIGPVIVAFAIFGGLPTAETTMNLEAVKIPYLILGAAFIVAAIFIKLSAVPDHIGEKNITHTGFSLTIKKPQVWMGMIAIFVYVGVEVSTASNLPEFMRQHLHTGEHEIAPYVSLFWASLMIGRWSSAAGAFNLPAMTKMRLGILLPFLAFAIFLLVNIVAGHSVSQFYPYLFLVIVLSTADAISEGHPVKQLLLYSMLGIAALVVGMLSEGLISVFAFISVGLFCSTLWPCIFTLSIAGLGDKTNTASSLLVMMIMGGGIISLLQGFLSDDALLGIQYSYLTGVCCFAYLAFFAWRIAAIHKAQGVGITPNP